MTTYELKNACLEAGIRYEQCAPAEQGKSAVQGWADDVGYGVDKCYTAVLEGWQRNVATLVQAVQRMADVIADADVEADRLQRKVEALSDTVQRIAGE